MTTSIKNLLRQVVRFLNQPPVKEGVKNVVGVATFACGVIEVYDTYQMACSREGSTEQSSDVTKMALACAKVSLLLSGATSRPGAWMISTLLGYIFSADQLARVWGPYAVFAVNPWHPRHIASLAATLLALPSVIDSIYRVVALTCLSTNRRDTELTDQKVRWMALFNTVRGRPMQHLGNQLCRAMIST
jgi:hypothetical protein